MRNRHLWALLVVVLVATVRMSAQEKNEKVGQPPEPNAVEVRFADDSVVKMLLQQSSIEVATRYGKLSVPANEIRRIEFGLRVSPETTRRIELAVSRLGSADFKQRDSATNELIALRELAYAALQQASKSTNPEVSKRAKDALKAITEAVPAEKLHVPQYDTVVAADFTIIGRIETAVLKARTAYFGETNLQLADLRSLRWLASEREVKVAVDAARYGAAQEAWLDTGIDIRAGAGLQISAGGTVDLQPAAGNAGTYVVGPDGMNSMRGPRGGFPGGGRAAAMPGGGGPGGGRGPGRAVFSSSSPGALLGRIGEFGSSFVVGSRFEAPAPEDGKLYLRIVPSPYGVDSSGSYDVRIIAGR